ncbi:MAG: hypothetical protein V1672_01570 [Candidatus Diapherotrites archaeon]
MKNHDTSLDIHDTMRQEELINKINPKIEGLSLDLQEIMELSKNPAFLSVLMYKLAQEREQTNKIMEQIGEKLDEINFHLRKEEVKKKKNGVAENRELVEVLPEQDQMIINLVQENGSVEAKDIKSALGYKGTNAASQRLNKLYKEGYLRKVQSGRKVLYLAKS